MIVKNPHKEEISMVYKGKTYTVEANGSLANVPDEVAKHWQTMVHEFIKLEKDVVKVPETIKAPEAPKVVAPKVEEKKEEKKEEVKTK